MENDLSTNNSKTEGFKFAEFYLLWVQLLSSPKRDPYGILREVTADDYDLIKRREPVGTTHLLKQHELLYASFMDKYYGYSRKKILKSNRKQHCPLHDEQQ